MEGSDLDHDLGRMGFRRAREGFVGIDNLLALGAVLNERVGIESGSTFRRPNVSSTFKETLLLWLKMGLCTPRRSSRLEVLGTYR